MAEITNEEIEAWARKIILEHDNDQPKQLEALYEAIKDEPVSTLIQLVGKDPIWSSLNNYILAIIAGGIRPP